jgi:hypothetical protein
LEIKKRNCRGASAGKKRKEQEIKSKKKTKGVGTTGKLSKILQMRSEKKKKALKKHEEISN